MGSKLKDRFDYRAPVSLQLPYRCSEACQGDAKDSAISVTDPDTSDSSRLPSSKVHGSKPPWAAIGLWLHSVGLPAIKPEQT